MDEDVQRNAHHEGDRQLRGGWGVHPRRWHGNVEETLILTLDVSTFEVVDVEEAPPEPEQQELSGTDEGAE